MTIAPPARAVLGVLLETHPALLSHDELARELFDLDPIDVADGIAALRRSGLAHDLSGYVWASRAAVDAEAFAR